MNKKTTVLFLFLIVLPKLGSANFCDQVFRAVNEFSFGSKPERFFKSQDNSKTYVSAMDSKEVALAFRARNHVDLLDSFNDSHGVMLPLETANKYLIAIEPELSQKQIANIFFHENSHKRFFMILENMDPKSKSILKDKSNSRRFRLFNLFIDEFQAHYVSFTYIPVRNRPADSLDVLKLLKINYVNSNNEFRDFVAVLYLTARGLSKPLDEIKPHHVILRSINTSFEEIDQVIRTKEFRSFRKKLYEEISLTPNYTSY